MGIEPEHGVHPSAAALAAAARTGGYAPSIHNTQPWRWRVHGDTLELHAVPSRQLTASDPSGRLMILSCGAALHHVRVALAADGWQAQVARLPEPDRPDLLARMTLTGRAPNTTDAMRLLQTIQIRHTDRRPVTDAETPPQTLDRVRQAAEAEGGWLYILRPEDVLDLATTADRAQTIETFDPQWREEIAYWAGGSRPEGLGIPDSAIPSESPTTTVPGRDFGHSGQLPISAGHDRAAVYAVLYGDEDSRLDWLRGGEALSAAWLTATELAVSVLPLSAAVEVSSTRQNLRRLLSNLGEPYIVLRFGMADPDNAGPPHTPRLPSAQVVEVVPEPQPGSG